MHAEWVDVSDATCKMITATQANRKRVVAVGTTVVRSLECAAREGGIKPFRGDTKLFIKPGFEFNVVDAMLTNFHLPKSTLLLLVSAFAGTDLIRRAYLHAVEQEYRFFSYGDAMYINKAELGER
jgi:S-adenosylmethionine:tRNA ribosyltransferase-isomerase